MGYTKVLNSVGQRYVNFVMELDTPLFYPVPILRDVSKHFNWNAKILEGQSYFSI